MMGLESCLAVPLNYSLEIKVQGASLGFRVLENNPLEMKVQDESFGFAA